MPQAPAQATARGRASGHGKGRPAPRVAGGPLGRRHGPATPWRERRASLRLAAGLTLAVGQRLLVFALALAVLAAFVAGIVEQRWKERALRDEVDARRTALQAAEARNASLRDRLAASNPEAYRAYVEDVARRQLNLGYPDETVVLVAWNDPPGGGAPAPAVATAPALPRPAPGWKRWLHAILGG